MSTFYCDPPYQHPHATESARDDCNNRRSLPKACACGAMSDEPHTVTCEAIATQRAETEQLVQMLDSMKDTCYLEGMWSEESDISLEEIKRRVRAAHSAGSVHE